MKFSYDLGLSYLQTMEHTRTRIAKTATATIRQAGDALKSETNAMIAGSIGRKFGNAAVVTFDPKSGDSLTPSATLKLKVGFLGVFENAATITGKPLLWEPIEQNLPSLLRGKNLTPKQFVKQVGPLRSARYQGKPVLLGQVAVGAGGQSLALPSRSKGKRAAKARDTYNSARAKWKPVFVGVESVTEPKRLDIAGVVEHIDATLGDLYLKNWEANGS